MSDFSTYYTMFNCYDGLISIFLYSYLQDNQILKITLIQRCSNVWLGLNLLWKMHFYEFHSSLCINYTIHFHSTPFLLLSPFPFTHQNSINSVILIIIISLVLSDEGSRNTPKAYKQVLTLMAGVSTEVISQTLLLGRLYVHQCNVLYLSLPGSL